ncbi:MAG: NAD(P)H-dependent oxidoreductase [Coriobacteriales bacterium]|nr:NAD(P)H-dependent oxidoreductase [Coriobacteriales bacterium]
MGHPYAESYNAALFKAYVDNIDRDYCDVETLELDKLGFDPVLRMGYSHRMPQDDDIDRSQELVKWADHIVFFYPIWFSNMPSLLKGWFERVITPKFAYNMKGLGTIKHLSGRTAEVFVTCDSPDFVYHFFRLPQWEVGNRLLSMAGIKIHGFHICGSTHKKTQEQREAYIQKVVARAKARR